MSSLPRLSTNLGCIIRVHKSQPEVLSVLDFEEVSNGVQLKILHCDGQM